MHALPVEPLRLLLVGLGPLGRIIAADVLERGAGRIVGAVDTAADLAGARLADLVAGGDAAVEVMPSVSAWLGAAGPRVAGVDAAIVATSSDLARAGPTILELLGAGVNVVSTCEELVFPWLRHGALADRLDETARRTGTRVLGTGVNPGFMMDTLPVFVTGVSKRVRAVRVRRIQDAAARRVPFQQKIGAGLDDASFERKVKEGTLRHVGLGESLHFVAGCLGWTVSRWEETLGPVPAERDMESAVGPIRAGCAAGVRQVARGYDAENREIITLEFQAAIGQADPHDRVVVEGEPPIDVVFRGGVHGDVATSAIVVNSIGPLLASRPGLHTMATIPMARWGGR
jgi:4-hydroxy-tetrahydrodipicolinate reductase